VERLQGITRDLKTIYTAPCQDAAKEALAAFQNTWHAKYPTITPMWNALGDIAPSWLIHRYSRVIYTTNTIEAVNRQIRKVIKTKGSFPQMTLPSNSSIWH